MYLFNDWNSDFFKSLWVVTLIGIQNWRTALTHLLNKCVCHDAVVVTFDVKSHFYWARMEGQCYLEGRVRVTVTLICKIRFWHIVAATFTFMELLRCSWNGIRMWFTKDLRVFLIWLPKKESKGEGRILQDSSVFAKKETEKGKENGKFRWSWKNCINEVPFKVRSVVFNITPTLAQSQIK